MNGLRKVLTLILCFLFPTRFVFWALNLMGHTIHAQSKIGFSILWINGKLTLEQSTSIGHFNLIRIDSLLIKEGGYIGRFNKLSGPFAIILNETAAIGNSNKANRAPMGITYGAAVLELGVLSKITGNHRLDLTRSIHIGKYSILAGHESQLWTHAYYHDKEGPGRFRIDGSIVIGNNVYIGSRCIINGGVQIVDAVVVGSNSCVSKSLVEPGTYVSQALRYIAANGQDARLKFQKVEGYELCEEVYEKKE